ncbi:gag-pol polyprotein [Tanacetum coccineum]
MITDDVESQPYNFQANVTYDDIVENLNKAMMLLAKAFNQKYSTPTNTRLRTSSNTHSQAYVQHGRTDVHGKNIGNIGHARNVGNAGNAPRGYGECRKTTRNAANARNVKMIKCYNCNGRRHHAKDCLKPRVQDSNYFKEQMLLVKNDEAGIAII